jgi:hypothetical protein
MPASISIERIAREGRKLHVYFSDSTSLEFQNRREARQAVASALDDAQAVHLLKMIAVARALRASRTDDDADDFDALVGKTLSINLAAPQNVVRVQ